MRKKKLLCIILSIFMVINLLPAGVTAASFSVSTYDQLVSTIQSILNSGDETETYVINLYENTEDETAYYITETLKISGNWNITINMNGVTINGTGSYTFIEVSNGANVTITDGIITNTYDKAISVYASGVSTNPTTVSVKTCVITDCNYGLCVYSYGGTGNGSGLNVTVNCEELSATTYGIYVDSSITSCSSSDVITVNGDITATGTGGTGIALNGCENVVVNGGTITGTTAAISVGNTDATILLYGGTYSSNVSAYVADGYSASENNGVWTVAHVHTYGTPSWNWSTDYSTCTATFTCVYDSTHTDTVTAAVSSMTTNATCTEDGETVYTASVTFEGTAYTDTKTVEIAATGHTTELQNAKDATCTEDGYTGDTVCTVCSETIEAGEVIAATGHSYTATFTWADDLNSATATLTCSDCNHTVDNSSLSVLVTSVNKLGVVTRTATVTFGGVTYTSETVAGKSLLTVQANYAAVNEAIARANALNASDYVDFSGVTAAINAVQWNLNVLNQNAVNAYAEAINTAIDNLVETSASITEETVEITNPVEAGRTDTE
ncbi:MAG: hypothetical protein LUE20_00915 [Oscillospiraceae bacterium]|nr:hypothetical protein [Oscillospiraceae bacterium]